MSESDASNLTDEQKAAKYDALMGVESRVATPDDPTAITEWRAALSAEFEVLVNADTVCYQYEDMPIPTACGTRANTARYMTRYHKTAKHVLVHNDVQVAYCVSKKKGMTNAPSIGVSLMMTSAEGSYDIPDGPKGEPIWRDLTEVLTTGHLKGVLVLSVEDAKVLFAPVQVLFASKDDDPQKIVVSDDDVRTASGLIATDIMDALDVPVRATTNTRDRTGSLVW